MATRRRQSQTLAEYSWILHSGDVAEQGKAAGLDTATGDVRPMGTSSTQIFIGFFVEGLTGDGTKKVRVQLASEIEAEWLANDANPNNVSAATIGSEVYAKDAQTVSTLSTSRSKAGRVLDYDSAGNRVLVQGGSAVTGPSSGTGYMGSVASIAALKAVAAGSRYDGQLVEVLADGSKWRFDATNANSLVSDGSDQLTIAPTGGTGIWIRNESMFDMRIAIDKTMADALALSTIPTGFTLKIVDDPHWVVTTGWSGGTNSAIGISTSNAAGSTKGDILGGAGGDLTATLGTAGAKAGTAGAKMDTIAHRRAFLLVAADTIRFDKIVSTYTAGAGYVDIPVCFALAA